MPTFRTADGAALHYLDTQRPGLPLVLVHGFLLDSDCFWPQLEALGARHRLVLPDLRGFGQSSPPARAMQLSDYAADVLALLDALGTPEAVLGGVSMGGYVAMAALRTAPKRARGLVLLNTHARADDEPARKRREDLSRFIERFGTATLPEIMLPQLLSPGAPAETRRRVERAIRAASPSGATTALRAMALRPDAFDVLRGFPGPALVVGSEGDALTPLERARELAEALPKARLLALGPAGHLAHLEEPHMVSQAIEELLRSAA